MRRIFPTWLLSCFFALLMGCTQEQMIFHPEVLPRDYRYNFSEAFTEVNIPVAGAAINALYFRVSEARGAVLYLHGNAGSLRTWGDVARDFTSRGYELFIFDYRGFGKSTGRIDSESQLLDDALAAYERLRETIPAERIVVYGRSIGAGMAAWLARNEKPRLLILESPFYSLTDLAAHHYPLLPRRLISLILKYPFPTDRWLPEVACPVYLIHGTKDAIVPFDDAVRLERLIRSPHELIRVEGGGHNDLGEFGVYRQALDRILTGTATRP
ncbi:MAG: alpha/beta fold hydrolase [Pseudomonadota bacterium]|nr:alpha/beta fold hydrolase [Pseudomonadota bacterium]